MKKQLKADFFLLSIALIWGASFSLMKNVLAFLPAFSFLSIRFFIASIFLVVIFHKYLKGLNKRTIIYSAIIGFLLFAGMGFQVFGLYTTKASNSAFITGMNVVMVPIVSAFLLKKKPELSSIIGVIVAFIGLFVLSGGLNPKFTIGDLLTLICAIFWTFQIISIDKFTSVENPTQIAVLQMVFAAFFNSIAWLCFDLKPMTFNITVVYTLLITAVLGTALAFAGQTIAQKYTTPTRTALILSAEPVFGAIFALIIPNSQGIRETLQLHTSIGCLLILAGMIVSELKFGKMMREKQ